MINLMLPIVLFFSLSANANLKNNVEDCYDNANNTEEASYCSDRELIRHIKDLRTRVKDLEGGAPVGTNLYATIFRCSTDSDPEFRRVLINESGNIIRDDRLETFDIGGYATKHGKCIDAIKGKTLELGKFMKSTCSCSTDSDPVLNMEILDVNLSTIKVIDIATFSVGGYAKKTADCKQLKSEIPICEL